MNQAAYFFLQGPPALPGALARALREAKERCAKAAAASR